jgi:hypothetical protein
LPDGKNESGRDVSDDFLLRAMTAIFAQQKPTKVERHTLRAMTQY